MTTEEKMDEISVTIASKHKNICVYRLGQKIKILDVRDLTETTLFEGEVVDE